MRSWLNEAAARYFGRSLDSCLVSTRLRANPAARFPFRITTQQNGEHHEVVPNHDPIKVGTLLSILKSVAAHHGLTVDELVEKIDLV